MLKRLKDECYIVMGQSPSSEYYNQEDNGIPFLQGRKTFGDKYPKIDTWTTKPSKVGIKNSVLMSVRAPVGDVNIAPFDICIGRGLASIKMKNNNNQYLYYLLKNNIDVIKRKSSGTVFAAINRSDLENLILNFNNEDEQLKIEKILNNIDKKIGVNCQINNNLLEIGISLVNKYFNEVEDCETLNNIIKFNKGKKPNDILKVKVDGYDKYLTIACLNGQELNYADSNKMLIANNDLLMVMDGASSGDVYYSDYGIVGSTLAKLDIVDENTEKEYIYFCLKKYNDLIKSKNTGSAIPHTDKVFVYSLEVPKIEKEKQQYFKVLLKKIQENEKENEILSKLRDTLLPKLMNGEIDLDNIEI